MALIQEIHSDLLSYYITNKDTLVNPQFIRKYNVVSWKNHQPREFIRDYFQFYDWVANNRQYSLMFYDDSFFQLYYEVANEALVNASLAYVPSKTATQKNGSQYIRFDCSHTQHKDHLHTVYHVHFGYETNLRVSLMQFPLPSLFLNFIILIFYGQIYSIPSKRSREIPSLVDMGYKFSHFLDLL